MANANGYTSGVPPQNPGDEVSARSLELMRQAGQRALPQKGTGTFVRQTPSGTIVSSYARRVARLPCCMGYQGWREPVPAGDGVEAVPPRESSFWIGASDDPEAANYNSGAPADHENKTCLLQNFWLRAERSAEDGYTEWTDYEGGYWQGNPDKLGQLDLIMNGRDAHFWMQHGHPSTGFQLNAIEDGSFLGAWGPDWFDRESELSALAQAVEEASGRYFFVDMSLPSLTVYGATQEGESSGVAKLDYRGGGLTLTKGDGTVDIQPISGKTAHFQQVQFCVDGEARTAYVLMTDPE